MNDSSDLERELHQMLSRKNGFYTFESALQVFPFCADPEHMNLLRWNDASTWKSAFGAFLSPYLCFAQDVFGEQFAILGADVIGFNPESGRVRTLAGTIEDWACRILTEYELLIGYPFAHDWQERFGPLKIGERLIPKKPFIFGGDYVVDKFYALDAVSAMQLRGDIYRQICDLPDGTKVRISVE